MFPSHCLVTSLFVWNPALPLVVIKGFNDRWLLWYPISLFILKPYCSFWWFIYKILQFHIRQSWSRVIQNFSFQSSKNVLRLLWIHTRYSLSMRVYGTEDGITVCEEEWTVPEHRVYFGIFTNIIQFVLPFFVIILCYIKIGIKMKGRESSNINSCRLYFL